ncbi:hypothetical protein CALVIDRAFT_539397 [Calocera viscosa TUFC12733]|uniref:Nitroreductase domain-containing protein n=1 Tax=Calocera viscosa (strain TUFC12733) TaxID=1330018 RepID=A0A167JWW5_CALVF|nr:hypothetical protein CALVIDRAFT_539397 [Calocera viscosa TUFC12733]
MRAVARAAVSLARSRPIFPSAAPPAVRHALRSQVRAMASAPSPSSAFLEVAKERRSYYMLKKGSPIPDSKIIEIVQEALKQAPSSFNSQTSRIVVLFGADHDWLWDTVLEVLKPIAPPEVYPNTVTKVNTCFKSGHGTVLFFEDNSAVKGMQEMYPLYQERFPGWAHETSAIIQFICWCALEQEGLGATLQVCVAGFRHP